MIVKDIIDAMAGQFRVIDDESDRTLAVMNTSEAVDWERYSWLYDPVKYISPSLCYFSNSKKAEYSAKLNIYI